MYYAINKTGNSKTGLIPVSTSSKNTCPDSCNLKEKGCYAKYSFLGGYWKKLSNGEVKNSIDYDQFLHSVKALPKGQLWRHNQAGDLLHNNGVIDGEALKGLVRANTKKRGFTYTHHNPLLEANKEAILGANNEGFTVNLSSDNRIHAEKLMGLRIAPVVTLLPVGVEKVTYTPNGHKIVKCPADSKKGITCATCQLCQDANRGYIIGFEAHGTAKKSVENLALDITGEA